MEWKKVLVLLSVGAVVSVGGCTYRDAAVVGATIGKALGAPFGVTGAALDEAAHTAGEIVRANPRYESESSPSRTTSLPAGSPSSSQSTESESASPCATTSASPLSTPSSPTAAPR